MDVHAVCDGIGLRLERVSPHDCATRANLASRPDESCRKIEAELSRGVIGSRHARPQSAGCRRLRVRRREGDRFGPGRSSLNLQEEDRQNPGGAESRAKPGRRPRSAGPRTDDLSERNGGSPSRARTTTTPGSEDASPESRSARRPHRHVIRPLGSAWIQWSPQPEAAISQGGEEPRDHCHSNCCRAFHLFPLPLTWLKASGCSRSGAPPHSPGRSSGAGHLGLLQHPGRTLPHPTSRLVRGSTSGPSGPTFPCFPHEPGHCCSFLGRHQEGVKNGGTT
jgi:hypothetical protein